ncbi:hypothetical protein [Dactylosporangium darangshiense]|uniref:hypothetical protein n=1 Tax=Dactylosporangium darangshiense TaxID=579108 RepID=UPI00363A1F8B
MNAAPSAPHARVAHSARVRIARSRSAPSSSTVVTEVIASCQSRRRRASSNRVAFSIATPAAPARAFTTSSSSRLNCAAPCFSAR